MELSVVQIGDVTSNDNRIVKLQRQVETETAIGVVNQRATYYSAVKADTVAVAEGDTVDLDLDVYNVVERPFTAPDGTEMMLKWIHLK